MGPGLWYRCCGKASLGETVSQAALLYTEGCLSPLSSYERGLSQLLTHSGLSSVVLGHVPEHSPHHHATTAQGALQQGSFEAAALQGGTAPLQCSATASLAPQVAAGCGCTWESWGEKEAKIVRGDSCANCHMACVAWQSCSPGNTQMAASTSWSLWPSSLLDHIFVSNFSGDQERLRCTISSISGSPVHGVVALTVKSSNVFITNFLSIITSNRAISWFLLPHSQVHIVSGVWEIKT